MKKRRRARLGKPSSVIPRRSPELEQWIASATNKPTSLLDVSAPCADCQKRFTLGFWRLALNPKQPTLSFCCPHCGAVNRVPWYWTVMASILSIPVTLAGAIFAGGSLLRSGLWPQRDSLDRVVLGLVAIPLLLVTLAFFSALCVRCYFAIAKNPFVSWWRRFRW